LDSASLLAFVLSALVALGLNSGNRRLPNAMLVAYLSVAGFSVLLPLLVITPTPDWRYVMPANVCWICSLLIAAASLPIFGGQGSVIIPDTRC
jgi:hypothetical protein